MHGCNPSTCCIFFPVPRNTYLLAPPLCSPVVSSPPRTSRKLPSPAMPAAMAQIQHAWIGNSLQVPLACPCFTEQHQKSPCLEPMIWRNFKNDLASSAAVQQTFSHTCQISFFRKRNPWGKRGTDASCQSCNSILPCATYHSSDHIWQPSQICHPPILENECANTRSKASLFGPGFKYVFFERLLLGVAASQKKGYHTVNHF